MWEEKLIYESELSAVSKSPVFFFFFIYSFKSRLFKQALICLRIPLQFCAIAPILFIFGTDSVPGMLVTC